MHRKRNEPHDVQEITARTLAYYESRAEEFRAGTQDHDVSQNIAALLRHIEGRAALHDSGFWLRTGPRSQNARGAWSHRDRAGRFGRLCRHGARRHRVRNLAAEFPCS